MILQFFLLFRYSFLIAPIYADVFLLVVASFFVRKRETERERGRKKERERNNQNSDTRRIGKNFAASRGSFVFMARLIRAELKVVAFFRA